MDFEGKYNTKSPAVKRLMREAFELKDPTEEYCAHPVDDNLFEWHFTVQGPSGTEFEGGLYHGRILLPTEYPMKPPNIILLTPNGRFEVQKKICLSISGHHPETWQPSWSIRTALLALIAFMPTPANGTIGAIDYTPEERQKLARKSQSWECPSCGKLSEILSKDPTGKPVTQDESTMIQNVVFKADETTESGQVTNTGNADSERIMNENANQTTIQENQPSSSPVFDSLSNILIGLIFAVIGFIVYRRVFWL
ncbi:ubiquitin-conjugating enzyme E2 J1-like [Macrosteles quadrilineatus]|uniref:ubiquitin-conjugating enzyme E2 J1-like n=2 Tax=Macrosteles quadrilineatus TaxID=74068 RepID=UPI0023E27F53|nr:ubiquitin-conjugating enzyme E2 J1-like [Macrosteles quadrilineatus]